MVSICVATYGPYPGLIERCLSSIISKCDRECYQLIVGCNAVDERALDYVVTLFRQGAIDSLHLSGENVNKCPMMRSIFSSVSGEYIWWFDDDSYIENHDALSRRLEIAMGSRQDTVMWGHQFFFSKEADFSFGTDVQKFVRTAPWFRGKTRRGWPASDEAREVPDASDNDERWFFMTGGCWFARTSAIEALDWPDPRLVKSCDDVLLGEAIRQQGWQMQDIGPLGVRISEHVRRGSGEGPGVMAAQMVSYQSVRQLG
jgi:hypothetical protein